MGGAKEEERRHPSLALAVQRHPSSAKASPLRAERRLLLPRRNAGQNCGEKARPRLKAVKTSGMDRRKIGQAQLTRPPQRAVFSWTASFRHALLGSLQAPVLFLLVAPVATPRLRVPYGRTCQDTRQPSPGGGHSECPSPPRTAHRGAFFPHPAQTIPGRFGRTASVSLASSSPSRHEAPPTQGAFRPVVDAGTLWWRQTRQRQLVSRFLASARASAAYSVDLRRICRFDSR